MMSGKFGVIHLIFVCVFSVACQQAVGKQDQNQVQASNSNERQGSLTGNFVIINDFYIPQLDKQRRIWIYLPPDYNSSMKHYPVLYMQDGQNLFDATTSFVGEWQIDETMEDLFFQGKTSGVIVVGIDHAGEDRRSEYSAWPLFVNGAEVEGKASLYLSFLVDTLKPYIDSHFRTKPSAQDTAIAGSSMGGTLSLYAGLQRPDVFGIIGAISPYLSRSAYGDQIRSYVSTLDAESLRSSRIYIDIGELEVVRGESLELIQACEDIAGELLRLELGQGQLLYREIAGARHSEEDWRRRFGDIVLWLFAGGRS